MLDRRQTRDRPVLVVKEPLSSYLHRFAPWFRPGKAVSVPIHTRFYGNDDRRNISKLSAAAVVVHTGRLRLSAMTKAGPRNLYGREPMAWRVYQPTPPCASPESLDQAAQ